jgi:hypothetical protein
MFYWNSHHVPAHQRNLRVSLLKPHAKFADAVDRLSMSVGRKLVLPLGVPVTLGS